MGSNHTIWPWNLSSKIFSILNHFILKLHVKTKMTWKDQFREMLTYCFILCGLPNTHSVSIKMRANKWEIQTQEAMKTGTFSYQRQIQSWLFSVGILLFTLQSFSQSPYKSYSKISFQCQKLRVVVCLFCSHGKKLGEIWNQTSSVTCGKWKCSWLSDDVTT